MELITWSVADMRYIYFCFGVYLVFWCFKQSTLRRISVNAVVNTCIFRELMWLSNMVVTPVF